MPIDPATGMWVDETSLVDPATGSPAGDIAPAVPEQTTMQRIQAGIDARTADLPDQPEPVTQFDMMAGQPGLGVDTAPPQITPVVKQTVREKVKGKPGSGQEVVRETTIEPAGVTTETTPVSTSSGQKVAVSTSRTGADRQQADFIDERAKSTGYNPAAMTTEVQQQADDLQAAITEESGLAQQYAKTQAEEEGILAGTLSNIEKEREKRLSDLSTSLEAVRTDAVNKIREREAQWELEKKELSRLIAINPASELYSGAGGAVGLGMIMTQAMGSYLTAMGVQNNLGEQMNQWVDRAQQYVTQRINGQKQALDATGDAITRVWTNAASDTAARAKVAEVGLLALDARIEAEKLKTSSKLKLASLNLVQAQVRTAMEEKRRDALAEEVKVVTHIATADAQRKASLAAAYQASTAAKIALENHRQQQADRLAAIQSTLPPGHIVVFDQNGKMTVKRAVSGIDEKGNLNPAQEKEFRDRGAAFKSMVERKNELTALRARYGDETAWRNFLGSTTPQAAEARALLVSLMTDYKVATTGAAASQQEMADLTRLAGATGRTFQETLTQVARGFTGTDPGNDTTAFLNVTTNSAYAKYSGYINTVEADSNHPAVRQLQGDVAAENRRSDASGARAANTLGGGRDAFNIISDATKNVAALGNARGNTVQIAGDMYADATALTKAYQAQRAIMDGLKPGDPAYDVAQANVKQLLIAGRKLAGAVGQAGVALVDRQQQLVAYGRGEIDEPIDGPAPVKATITPGGRAQYASTKVNVLQQASETLNSAQTQLSWVEDKL